MMGVLYVCRVLEYSVHAVDDCCSAMDRLGQKAMDGIFVAEWCLLHSCLVSLSRGRERRSFVLGAYRILMRKSLSYSNIIVCFGIWVCFSSINIGTMNSYCS